jgi:hypothetical protein
MTNFLTMTMHELVAYYNAHAATPVKRFADRKTAERRCAALAVTPVTIDPVETPITAALVAEQAVDHSASNARIGKMLAAEAPIIGEFVNCPHCGIHLSNGYTTYEDLRADRGNLGVDLSDMTHEYMCLGCCGYFGPTLKRARAATGAVAGPRPAMSQSLKLDRRITCVDTGAEYANACQVWKAGLVSAAQGDRLSSLLYGAAKRGEFNTVAVNGHSFKLTVGGAA